MMTSDELSRFEALVEREAEGEPLSADERAFVERYASQHPEAAEELELLRALSGALAAAPRTPQPGDRELIAQVFAQGQALERGRRRRALIAGGVALAAGVALWLARPGVAPELPRAATPVRAPLAARAVLATLSPGVSVDGVSAVAGAELRQGQRLETQAGGACLKLDRDVRACLSPGSLARVQSLGGDVVLALERGTLAADLGAQPAGTSFSVQSGALTVRAIGTRFGVQVASAVVQLNVLSGIVEVRGDGATYRVSAPGRTALGTRHVEQLSDGERQATEGLLAPVLPEASGSLEPVSPPAAATPERASSAAPAPVSSAESAGELLSRAREQRASGAMKDAARAYRRLLAEHPASAEAHTARVALGQLELSSLADPAGALGHFGEYLRRGGPLEQEARYGQVRALAALGRAAEEKQAIATFLAKYPKALQSAALKERLKTLGGTGATLKE